MSRDKNAVIYKEKDCLQIFGKWCHVFFLVRSICFEYYQIGGIYNK